MKVNRSIVFLNNLLNPKDYQNVLGRRLIHLGGCFAGKNWLLLSWVMLPATSFDIRYWQAITVGSIT